MFGILFTVRCGNSSTMDLVLLLLLWNRRSGDHVLRTSLQVTTTANIGFPTLCFDRPCCQCLVIRFTNGTTHKAGHNDRSIVGGITHEWHQTGVTLSIHDGISLYHFPRQYFNGNLPSDFEFWHGEIHQCCCLCRCRWVGGCCCASTNTAIHSTRALLNGHFHGRFVTGCGGNLRPHLSRRHTMVVLLHGQQTHIFSRSRRPFNFVQFDGPHLLLLYRRIMSTIQWWWWRR